MDSTFSTLGFVMFGIFISFYALVVQSEIENRNNADSPLSSPTTSPPPAPATPPPRPSPSTPESPSRPVFPPRHSDHRRGPPPHRRPPPPARRIKRSPPPPPPPNHQMNPGKKVGLLFLGIAGIMQVGMVVFLAFKRRQLLSTNDRYETCS